MSTSIFGLPATVALMLLALASALGLVLLIRGLRGRPPVPGIEVAPVTARSCSVGVTSRFLVLPSDVSISGRASADARRRF